MTDRIEELAQRHWDHGWRSENASMVNIIAEALRELAAEKDAEIETLKELAVTFTMPSTIRTEYLREIAELKSELLALQKVCKQKHDALVNARGWILANAKTSVHALMEYTNSAINEDCDLSLLDEVRRVLGDCATFMPDPEALAGINQLLTKLGHE